MHLQKNLLKYVILDKVKAFPKRAVKEKENLSTLTRKKKYVFPLVAEENDFVLFPISAVAFRNVNTNKYNVVIL